jgi:hypothetical protein
LTLFIDLCRELSMASNDLLLKGIAAAQEGNKEQARTLLSKVVLEMPDSEEAWWWLSQCVEDPQQREFCLKKVLEINPGHSGAKSALQGTAEKPAPVPPRAGTPSDQPAALTGVPGDDISPPPPKKAAKQTRAMRSTRQTIILILLACAVLIVFIGGAAYIFLDSTGYLSQLSGFFGAGTADLTPTPAYGATATIEGASLSNIPTWTPTISPTPPPATPSPTQTDTPEPTGSPTPIPPTPSELPEISAAQPVVLDDGTGLLTLLPDSFSVFEFVPRESLDLQTVASLIFHMVIETPTTPATVEVYLWNLTSNTWEPFGVTWGNNPIVAPGRYVRNDGVILAAIRNWGETPIDVDNASFTFAGRTSSGLEIIYGLNRSESRLPPTAEPTSTAEFG